LILSAGSDQAPTPRLACRLAETLGELGVHRDLADYLVAAPERAYWAEQWATWFPAIAHRIRNPRGFLASRIEGAAAGNPAYQIPPGEYLDRQEAGAKRQRQAERTQSLLAAIPKPEAREEPPAAPVAPELAPFWETLRGAATGAARGLLDHAAPLRVDTGRLVVAAPEGVRLQLRKREGPLAAALTDRHPEITGIEWVAPAAAGETGECSS
jgi:hypothetical protein